MQLKTLLPTNESFRENVKRGILQTLVWYATLEPDPPDLDPALFGWTRDESNKVLLPTTVEEGVLVAPGEILNMVKCGCSLSTACSSKHCTCSSASVSCSMMCKCCCDTEICHNKENNRTT